MRLCEYLINGTPVSQHSSFDSNLLAGISHYLEVGDLDSIPENYVNISSIENWYKLYENIKKDYKYAREEIRKLLINISWENLTQEEKVIVSKMFLVSKDHRDELFTLHEQIQLGAIHHQNSIQSRLLRLCAIQLTLFNTLEKHDWQEVGLELTQTGLLDRYVNQGIEGTLEGDIEGFFDYILSRTGTSFENSGFLNKSYTPLTMTLQQIADRAIDILKNGNY